MTHQRAPRLALAAAPLLAAALFAGSAFAIAPYIGIPVEEVPVSRILENVEKHRASLPENWYWTVVGRIHLLAYIRDIGTLPVYKGHPEALARGPFQGCWPIVPTPEMLTRKWVNTCTEWRPDLYPAERALPEGALGIWRKANSHLRAALAAYEKVKSLPPPLIRTHLALAYIYDRLGRFEDARKELRYVIDLANGILPAPGQVAQNDKYTGNNAYWGLQLAAAEAVAHLKLISKKPKDLARVRSLSAKLRPMQPIVTITPILIPLKPARTIAPFINPTANVAFDFTGQGVPLKGGWITKDAAWLVWDPHDKQKITSGFQLFGSVTWLTPWDNGYLALATLDDNGDGKIAGRELEGLALWHDLNANGISERGEVKPVTAWHIEALIYRHTCQNKDAWTSPQGVTFTTGESRPTYDWNIRATLITAEVDTESRNLNPHLTPRRIAQ